MQEMQETQVWPLVGKIPWSRKWQPVSVILPGIFMDRGAWWATVLEVAKSRTRLSDFTSLHHWQSVNVRLAADCTTVLSYFIWGFTKNCSQKRKYVSWKKMSTFFHSCLIFQHRAWFWRYRKTLAPSECKVSWGKTNNNVKKTDDNKSLKDEFSKE